MADRSVKAGGKTTLHNQHHTPPTPLSLYLSGGEREGGKQVEIITSMKILHETRGDRETRSCDIFRLVECELGYRAAGNVCFFIYFLVRDVARVR